MNDFTFIKRGRGVVLYEGRQFYKKKTYASSAEWWRCCDKKCSGSMTIQYGNIIKNVTHVTHCVADPAKNMWAEQLQLCKDKVCITEEPIPKLYVLAQETFKNKGYDLVCNVLPIEAIKAGLYRKRNKNLGVRKLAQFKNTAEIIILQKFQDFVLADYNFNDERIIVFRSKNAIEQIENLEHFFGDGTFTACIPSFNQIYSIHGDCGSIAKTTNISPLIYALMTKNNYLSYRTGCILLIKC